MSTKTCVACGMPMRSKDDFAGGNGEKDYCKYCTGPDGSMQSYEEKLVGMTGFLVRTQGLDEGAAKELAARQMAKLPAWAGRTE